MKNIIFFTLSFIWLIFFVSCEKNFENWEKISEIWEINFFEWKNFLASWFDIDWNPVPDEDTSEDISENTSEDIPKNTLKDISENTTVKQYSNHKNKWFRDCIEQDFKCKWADNDCKFLLWQNVWWCAFWCWEWNNEVEFRLDSNWKEIWCNDKSLSWQIARKKAEENCFSGNYTWSIVWSFCYNADAVDQIDWKNPICICWEWNKWIMDWENIKISYNSPFCEIEWKLDIVKQDDNKYFLAKCTKNNDWFKYYIPDSSDKWKLWFHEIAWKVCTWDLIWKSDIFYADAIWLWQCAKNEFTCDELITWSTWVWLWSAETNNITVQYKNNNWGIYAIKTHKMTDFNNTWCSLRDESMIVTHFEVCFLDDDNNCTSKSWTTLKWQITDNTELSLKIIGKNSNNEVVNDWYYKVIVWGTGYKDLKPSSTSFIWSSSLWNKKMIDWPYTLEIISSSENTRTWADWNEEYIYEWGVSKWFTITFSWVIVD